MSPVRPRHLIVVLGLALALFLTVAGPAAAWTLQGAGVSSAGGSAGSPSIWSDKADYAPGETVTLSGAGWQPGEAVHILVNDDEGQTWSHSADVTAADDGTLTDEFALPSWLVALYTVSAAGEVSGTATTTFTDAVSAYQEGSAPTGTCADPGNALSTDDSRALCDDGENLVATGFDLQTGVPSSATDISFRVRVEGRVSDTGGTDNFQIALDDGTGFGSNQTTDTINTNFTQADSAVEEPSSTACDTFNRTWSYGDLTDANFKARVTANPSSSTDDMDVDDFDVLVCWAARIVTAATVNGGSTTTVAPSAAITTTATVNHTGVGGNTDDWRCTSTQIEGQSVVNHDHANFDSDATDGPATISNSTGVTAPSAPGTYDITFIAYSNDSCTNKPSAAFTLTDAITVQGTGTVELKKVWSGTAGNVTLKIGTSAGGSQVDSQPLTGTNGTTGQNTVVPLHESGRVSGSFDLMV